MAGKNVTKQEALQYDPESLAHEIERKKKNIKVFEETILNENLGIKHEENMISVIDKKHPDVKKLENNIAKRRTNIKTFEDAIFQEKNEIEREKEMIRIIKKNKITN
jgi:hypothetical protein